MGTQLNITIKFASGPDYVQSFAIGTGFPFFGFVSSVTDIQSATLYGNAAIPFAIDNFTYPTFSAVPEPSSIVMAGLVSLLGLGFAWCRRPSKVVA